MCNSDGSAGRSSPCPDSCGLCGHDEAGITEVRTVRQGLAWMNPAWSPEIELFEVCSSCGARRELEGSRVA